jgi:hypothetical protein
MIDFPEDGVTLTVFDLFHLLLLSSIADIPNPMSFT